MKTQINVLSYPVYSKQTINKLRTRTALGDKSFAVAGPDSLPATLRQIITSYEQFRLRLEIAEHRDF